MKFSSITSPTIGALSAALVGAAILLAPMSAEARGRVGVGVVVGPGYYGYGGPGYYYPGYYFDGPAYYYPPPQVVYEAPQPVIVEQAPGAFWYYCPPAKNYFPYVRECPTGWQAVPAQAQAANNTRPAAPAPAGRVTYRLGDVLFATGRSELQPTALGTLDSLLASINKEPNRHIVIEGHTDTVGSNADNLSLSQRRADAVKQYLIAHGVPADRVTAVGKGDAGAIADNATAEGRQQNRRVDIIVS